MRLFYLLTSYILAFIAVSGILRLLLEGRQMEASSFAWVLGTVIVCIAMCGWVSTLRKREQR